MDTLRFEGGTDDQETAIALWEESDVVLLLDQVRVDQALINRLVRSGRIERVSFAGATFEGPVSFAGVPFLAPEVDFTAAMFQSTVDFSDATVDEQALIMFERAHFAEMAKFDGLAGGRFMSFKLATFASGCSFRAAVLPPMAKFAGAEFHGAADFGSMCLGANYTVFESCSFGGAVDLSVLIGDDGAKLSFLECEFDQSATGTPLPAGIVFTDTNNVPEDALQVLSPTDGATARPLVGNIAISIVDAPFEGTSYQAKTVRHALALVRRLQPKTSTISRTDTGFGVVLSASSLPSLDELTVSLTLQRDLQH